MILKELKKYVLELIEEIDTTKASLTNDPDIAAKLHGAINHVMHDICRIKKLPDYVEMEVAAGQKIRFSDIENESGYEVYQLDVVRGAEHELKANGSIIKVMEDGILEIEYFRYPERITDKTKDSYEFELPADILEIMPFGIAADILKSDVSTNYGSVYAQRYESMLQRLDTKYSMGSITIEGGIDV